MGGMYPAAAINMATPLSDSPIRTLCRAIRTVARVRAAANVAVDPTGRYLAIASIENAVHRLELATLKLERVATVEGPHGVAYDREQRREDGAGEAGTEGRLGLRSSMNCER